MFKQDYSVNNSDDWVDVNTNIYIFNFLHINNKNT